MMNFSSPDLFANTPQSPTADSFELANAKENLKPKDKKKTDKQLTSIAKIDFVDFKQYEDYSLIVSTESDLTNENNSNHRKGKSNLSQVSYDIPCKKSIDECEVSPIRNILSHKASPIRARHPSSAMAITTSSAFKGPRRSSFHQIVTSSAIKPSRSKKSVFTPSSVKKKRESSLTTCQHNASLFSMGHEFLMRTAMDTSNFIKRLTRHHFLEDDDANCSLKLLKHITGDSKEFLLELSNQKSPILLARFFNKLRSKGMCKLGEGCFGEVFQCSLADGTGKVAIKLMPIEGDISFNGEKQKSADEVLSELIVSQQLSNLTVLTPNSVNYTENFVKLISVRVLKGKFPPCLLNSWDMYHQERISENDNPRRFPHEQLWVGSEAEFAGVALEDSIPDCYFARLAIWRQIVLALAVAEAELKFEHRDLHIGNVLVRDCLEGDAFLNPIGEECLNCAQANLDDQFNLVLDYLLDGQKYQLPTFGLKAVIIDFTLSRLNYKNSEVFLDLSQDEQLFQCHGDYQFKIYPMMRKFNGNNWRKFEPKSNVAWMHYLLDKLSRPPSKRQSRDWRHGHGEGMRNIMALKNTLLNFSSCRDIVENSGEFSDYLVY